MSIKSKICFFMKGHRKKLPLFSLLSLLASQIVIISESALFGLKYILLRAKAISWDFLLLFYLCVLHCWLVLGCFCCLGFFKNVHVLIISPHIYKSEVNLHVYINTQNTIGCSQAL